MANQYFPILKLPLLCINEILTNYDLCELIEISLLSARMNRIIKSIRVDQFHFKISIFRNRTHLRWMLKNKMVGEWIIFGRDCSKKYGENEKYLVAIDGIEMFISHCKLNGITHLRSFGNNAAAITSSAIHYTMDLFKLKINKIYLEPFHVDNPFLPHKLGIRQCQYLHLKGKVAMDEENLRGILVNIEVTNKLHLNIPLKSGLPMDPMSLSVRQIRCVQNHNFVNRDILLSFKFDVILLDAKERFLTKDDLNEFINQWLNSKNRSFKLIRIRIDGYELPENFRGFMALESDPTNISFDRDSRIDLAGGFDIQRKDGLEAAIFYDKKVFRFRVWHELFHEEEEVDDEIM